jgi:hypothetical protein
VAPGGAGTSGTCQLAGSQVGAPCDGSLKTAAGCDGSLGLYCDGLTKMCSQATYAGAGQPCGYDLPTGTFVGCTSGTCEGASAAQAQLGQCSARAAEKGACNVPDGGASTPSAGCLPPDRCISPSGATGICEFTPASSCP